MDWVINFSMYPYVVDEDGSAINSLYKKIQQGKLKDPRDIDSTSESRDEFLRVAYGIVNKQEWYGYCPPSDWSEQEIKIYIDTMLLVSKIAAITPPQGYPNAPFYYTPERLEWIYQKGDLDKRLNPTIPAMYRANFPEDLRKKIESYAKEHNIKD